MCTPDAVLLWDGENAPRWEPWAVADVGQPEFTVASIRAGKTACRAAQAAWLSSHCLIGGDKSCCTGAAPGRPGCPRDERRDRGQRLLGTPGRRGWCRRRPDGWSTEHGRPPAGPAERAPGTAGHGLAADRAAPADAGLVHLAADAGAVRAGGGRSRDIRPAVDPGPMARHPASARAGQHAMVGGGRGHRGGCRVRRRTADLSLPADHRRARPRVLHPVRGLDRASRFTPDSAVPSGVRRHPSCAYLRQPRVLPGRRQHRAAVHGRAPDDPGGRLLGRGGKRGGPGDPGARRGRGADVRRTGGPAGRAAVGAAGGSGSRPLPAGAVHQPVGFQ